MARRHLSVVGEDGRLDKGKTQSMKKAAAKSPIKTKKPKKAKAAPVPVDDFAAAIQRLSRGEFATDRKHKGRPLGTARGTAAGKKGNLTRLSGFATVHSYGRIQNGKLVNVTGHKRKRH